MPENAEAVSATFSTNRNCTVEITNVSSTYCLINPKVFMSSGFSFHPPQPTIRTGKTEVCSFDKDDNSATGAVGLLTYDLFTMQTRACSQRVAFMFSVPFDHNIYKNRVALGVVELSRACDKQLYEQMYGGKDVAFCVCSDANGSGMVHKTPHVELRATMSTVGKAILKVEIYDKLGH
ncbi:hypothetical protein NHX12_031991 [Muraenolepis orangiensis]|uniref:Uncharacterized protein n=1 Tax=Muraenolepis orangiensis TaxID=630683 RepID=A0A9Q0IK70_9TELE|nr:hypothetical protein NHX12_031991 [Muraenolepis orangiensis]